VPAAAERSARYAQVEKLLVERNSQRSIVRTAGVSRMTVAKLAKKSAASRAAIAGSLTDLFPAYVGVLPPKGSGGTSIIEAVNYSLRQRCGCWSESPAPLANHWPCTTSELKLSLTITTSP